MSRTIEGAHVLVTGANRGIGSAFVEVLMDLGAARVIACARDPRTLEGAVLRHGPRLVPVELDVTEAVQVSRVASDVGRLDLLISNAGREGSGTVIGMDEADARHLFEVHLWGPWRLAQALAPAITDSHGGMVFVQSIAALALSRRGPFYSASKAAALMMANAMRESMRAADVTVTNVFPGFTDTDMLAGQVEVPKADPRTTAMRVLDAWAAGEESVYPDRFAELMHDRLQTDIDGVIDDPAATVTDVYRTYLLGGQPSGTRS